MQKDYTGRGPTSKAPAVEFLHRLRPGGPWVLTAIAPDGPTETITAHSVSEALQFVAKHDGQRNLYYAVNPLRGPMTKKAAKTDVAAIEFLHADLDPQKDETPEAAKTRYLAQLDKFESKPTAIIDSGNGIQALWQLSPPIALGELVQGEFADEDQAKIDDAEARTKAIMLRLGAPAGTQNIDRILRLPGTINLPNAKKRKSGRVPCPAVLLEFNGGACALDDFPKAKEEPPPKEDPHVKHVKGIPNNVARALYIPNAGAGVPHAGYESRNALLFGFLIDALRAGVDDEALIEACLNPKFKGMAIYEHVQDNGGEPYIKRQIERALNRGPTATTKKVIRLKAGKMDEAWRETERALLDAQCPVYVRGGKLVQPLWRWEKTRENDGSERQVLTAQFVRFNIPRLADVIAHHAVQFQVFDSKKKQWKNIDPPVGITVGILEAGHWGLSSVIGIANSPIMRPDGSLLTEPGYDPATQIWYKSSGDVTLPSIPQHPTKEDAEKALALLNGLLAGFPFEGEDGEKKTSPSRSVALAGIMTTVLRGTLPAPVPLFAIVGTEPRTGKTYLVTLIALIATGHVPISQGGSEKKEEFEKRVESAALTGLPILHFNNLPNGMVVESERLSELSTEGTVYIRKLGRHDQGLCDCRATTLFMNGNNILVAADLVLRTATCRLNPQTENPEERKFEFDPTELVRKDRGRYLAAVFTIARAFITAGCPPQNRKVVAGFEGWARLVQQPLIWLGMDDPLGNMDTMRGMDPKEEELERLLNVLKKYHDKLAGRFTVADCTRLAEETASGPDGMRYMREDLRALMYNRGKIDGHHFGSLLMRSRDRVRDGWQIRIVASGARAKAYQLVGPPEAFTSM